MLQRTPKGTATRPIRPERRTWPLVATLIAVAGIVNCACRADFDAGSGRFAAATPVLASVSIARAHPDRSDRLPAIPGEAFTEAERANEDVEEGGDSNHFYPAGFTARRCIARLRRTGLSCGAYDAAGGSVSLTVLCRLQI